MATSVYESLSQHKVELGGSQVKGLVSLQPVLGVLVTMAGCDSTINSHNSSEDGRTSSALFRDVSNPNHAILGHWVAREENRDIHYYFDGRRVISPRGPAVWDCYIYEVESSSGEPFSMILTVLDVTGPHEDMANDPYRKATWKLSFDEEQKRVKLDSIRIVDGFSFELELEYADEQTEPD